MPAISQRCPLNPKIPYMHNNNGDWAVPLRLACMASYNKWNDFRYPENTRRTFVQTSELSEDHADNAPTDLRSMGVSSDLHTFVIRVLHT